MLLHPVSTNPTVLGPPALPGGRGHHAAAPARQRSALTWIMPLRAHLVHAHLWPVQADVGTTLLFKGPLACPAPADSLLTCFMPILSLFLAGCGHHAAFPDSSLTCFHAHSIPVFAGRRGHHAAVQGAQGPLPVRAWHQEGHRCVTYFKWYTAGAVLCALDSCAVSACTGQLVQCSVCLRCTKNAIGA